jgi:O-methyltransferase
MIMELPKLDEIPLDTVLNFSSDTYWGVTDPQRFRALLEEAKSLVLPGHYLGDNFFTWGRNNSPLEDKPFCAAWKSNIQNDSDQAIVWRRYIVACAAYHAIHLPGDFVECGVYKGTGIKTVIDYLGGPSFPKTFWGYDTFDYNPVEGVVSPDQKEGFHQGVLRRFDDYVQVRLIKGFLPESFSQGCPKQIAFLHIDLNNVEAEIAVLDHLFDKVVRGGMIVLDDYEMAMAYRPQKQQEDLWFDSRGYRVFPLPTGQGFVIKR